MKMFLTFFAAAIILISARGDVVNLANGDRFIGSVQLVNEKEVHLKSEIAGVIKVPREKVTSIHFGTNQPSLEVGVKPLPGTKTDIDPKAIQQVQQEFLATAGPEANAMFTELVQGLSSGKLSVGDIREQARQSLQELRDLQAEIGGDDEENALLANYVGILERFINAGTNKAKPAAPKIVPQPKPAAELEE